jgi:hypothetical protein
MLKLPEFLNNQHTKVARLSAMCTGDLSPQQIPLVLISVRCRVNPTATVRPEGLSQWKIPMTPSGNEKTTTLQLAAQCLNQLHHSIPLLVSILKHINPVHTPLSYFVKAQLFKVPSLRVLCMMLFCGLNKSPNIFIWYNRIKWNSDIQKIYISIWYNRVKSNSDIQKKIAKSHVNFLLVMSFQKNCASVRNFLTVNNMLGFYGEGLLTPQPIHKLEEYSLSAIHNCLFSVSAASLHIYIWMLSPLTAAWGHNTPCWQGPTYHRINRCNFIIKHGHKLQCHWSL